MGVAGRAAPKDIQEAFRATCYAHPQGVEHLAALMGMTPGVLYNKCNCNDSSHNQPTMRDLVLVQVITGDKRVTHALAQLLGGTFVDLGGFTSRGDDAVLDLVTAWMKEQGDLFAAFQEAYGDGIIDAKDLKKIRKEAYDVLQAVMSFVTRVETMKS